METVYFLIFIGVCAFVVVWATRKPGADTDLAHHNPRARDNQAEKLLKTPADSRLAHKEEIWDERRRRAKKGFNSPGQFVPRFETTQEPEDDGYSRRDRHHVTAHEHVKKEAHVDQVEDLAMPSIKYEAKGHASQT